MAVDIDSLQIEIEATSSDAASKIDQLATALTNLKSAAKGGAGLTTTTKQLQALSNAAKLINETNLNSQKIEQFSSAMNSLSSIQKASGLSSTINALKKLPEISTALDKDDLGKFAQQMDQVASAMRPLATEMQKVANGFSAFPIRIQKIIQSNSALTVSNNKTAKSFGVLGTGISSTSVRLGVYYLAFKKVAEIASDWVKSANDYIEATNLFQVSMGDYYDSAMDYVSLLNDKMGINPTQWMDAQGTFMLMAKGFGIAESQAYKLSKSLTELAYDISSLKNIDVDEAVTKLRSALAGELEPIRGLGLSISQATLQEYALSKGINESVAAMTEQEKALLRSVKVLEDSSRIGYVYDFARTLESPANAMRILRQQIVQLGIALGSILLPIIVQIIPWIQAFVKVITAAISAIASLFGFTMPSWDFKDWSDDISTGANDAASSIGGANGAAKELKKTLLGIDELNLLAKETGSGGGGSGGAGGGLSDWASGLEIPSLWDEEVIRQIETKADELAGTLENILTNYVIPIGAGFAAWKIASGVLTGISTLSQMLKNLPSGMLSVGVDFKVIGLTMFLADLNELRKYIDDIANNGANFKNVAGVISEFAGTIGDAFVVLGAVKIGSALKALQGIGEIVIAIKDISDNGVNWENATTAIRGLTNVAISIGLFVGGTSGIKFAAASVAVQGMNTVISELAENWDAIKKGDWSGVDKATLAIGAIEILGGVAVAIGKFSALKSTVDTAKATKSISDVTTATESVSTATSTLSPNLTSLAKNLGMGVVIITEVAAAAAIFVGSIALIGYELGLVADAWTPVIDNAGTVAISVATGTGILVAIGAATYALGSAGATAAINIGIGTLVLAELGIATGLFIVEIWAIGEGLNKIGEAWQPVLDNGGTIATGIAIGTGLLIGIGVVTAALGVATVGSYGLLPVAIALGTAILVELAVSFVAFTESLVAVSDELSGNLAPSLANLNLELPSLKTNMSNFTDYMIAFADEVGSYTDSMGSITWSSIVDGFLKIFSGNPIGDLSDDIYIVYIDVSALNEKLRSANPEIQIAIDLLSSYNTLMTTLGQLTQGSSNIQLATEIFTNLKEAGSNLVLGFSEGVTQNIGVAYSSMENLGSQMMLGIYNSIERDKVYVRYSLENLFAGVKIRVPTFSISGGFNLMTGSVPSIRVDWFANGGFPEQGQMFIANEQGPELVGQIGNRTAVANNDQIVTAVSQGVYDANAEQNAILREQNRLLTQILEKTGVSIDGYEFANSLTKYQSDRKRALGV